MARKIEDREKYSNVSFEATKEFKEALKERAKSKRMSQSEYIRECIRRDLRC